jgi:hypothetical protein
MEIQQFLSLILKPRGINYGPKEMDFNTGNIDFDFENECRQDCAISQGLLGCADELNKTLIIKHLAAENNRMKHENSIVNKKNKGFYTFFKETINSLFSF